MKPYSAVSAICIGLFLLAGPQPSAMAATNVFAVVNNGVSAYVINATSNPDLSLVRGFTYTFNVSASGHPFWIKTIQGTGTGNAYEDGVTGNGTAVGTVQFSIPTNSPSLLFYNCQFHSPMTGRLHIEDPPVVHLAGITVTTNIVLSSTGTDSLNLYVDTTSNLVEGTWQPAPLSTNIFSQGTNITSIDLLAAPVGFFRVRQGLP